MVGFPRVYTKPPKVRRRTTVHDLRRPKLPSEERYMTMHSYVWKMWRWGQQRSHTSDCLYQNCTLREKRPYLFTPFFLLYRSTDQAICYFFNVVEVWACFWTVPGQLGAELPIFICALNNHLTNRNHFLKISFSFSYRKKGPR